MTIGHLTWHEAVVNAAHRSTSQSPRVLLDDERGPNLLNVRWGSPLTDSERLDFFIAVCDEMHSMPISADGNDRLEGPQLESFLWLLDQLSKLDQDTQGTRGVTVRSALAAAEHVFPYLDAHFAALNDAVADTDITQPA
jgi:hypothetical protein